LDLEEYDKQSLLTPEGWLSNRTINLFLKSYRSDTINIFQTEFIDGVTSNSDSWGSDRARWYTDRCMKSNLTIIPIHVQGNHWSVVFFYPAEKILYLCDPFRTTWEKSEYRKIFIALAAFFSKRLGCDKNDFKGVSTKMPKQENLHDCGVFMLRYVEEFLGNPSVFKIKWDNDFIFENYSSGWAKDYRKKIYSQLVSPEVVALEMKGKAKNVNELIGKLPDDGEITIDKDKTVALFNIKIKNKATTIESGESICSLVQKCSDSIGNEFCTADDQEVLSLVSNITNYNEDLQWISGLDLDNQGISGDNFESFCSSQVKALSILDSTAKAALYFKSIKRFRLGMRLIEEVANGGKTKTKIFRDFKQTHRVDPNQLEDEYFVKKYFIKGHPSGIGILRCLDMPWYQMARNPLFKNMLDRKLLYFGKRDVLRITYPTDNPTTSSDLKLLEELGLEKVQELLSQGDTNIWRSKSALKKVSEMDLESWAIFARKYRTIGSRFEAAQTWVLDCS
jgi:hypothetical protein